MVSYCSRQFDDLEVLSSKSSVPDILISIFQECDRVDKPITDEGETRQDRFRGKRSLKLYDIPGLTSAAARQTFEDWRDSKIEPCSAIVEENRGGRLNQRHVQWGVFIIYSQADLNAPWR